MDAGNLIAVYAAAAATASVGWQVFVWRRSRATRLEVSVHYVLAPTVGDGHFIGIRAVNRSDHPVRVTGVGLNAQDGSGSQLHILQRALPSTLPGEVGPRDAGQAFISIVEAQRAGIDPAKPVTAWVRLPTDDVVTSKPKALSS